MTKDELPGMAGGYARRDFDSGPKTYRDPSFNELIFGAMQLANLQPGSRIMDLMSGPGKLGLALEVAVAENHPTFLYLDFNQNALDQIPDAAHRIKICSDVRDADLKPESVDRIVTRYALKDIPEEQQLDVVKAAARALKPGGIFVLADMVPAKLDPEDDAAEWLNAQHSMKQIQNGRDVEIEGECYIRTISGWQTLLLSAGLQPEVSGSYTSKVITAEWLKSGQVTPKQLSVLNRFILTAPDPVQATMNIRQETDNVKIDFPVTIISAQKTTRP